MVLVCGLKTDGGVLRSFVVEAPVGGSAFQSGVLEGETQSDILCSTLFHDMLVSLRTPAPYFSTQTAYGSALC